MKPDELVSIIVPVYNRAHLIARSVGSLCAQSYRNIEILIVDDCSTDDIEGAVAALDDPRARLVRREVNGGAAAARNTGLAAARGDLIAFHDSDDICIFDKIERQVELLCQLPADYIGVHSVRLFHDSLSEADYARMRVYVRPFPHETPLSGDLSRITLKGNSFNLPTLLVRKSALIAAGTFDESMRNNEDWDLALRLTRQGKLGFVTDPLYLTEINPPKTMKSQRISRSTKYSAQSFARITGKIRHAGFIDQSLANHYVTTALHFIRMKRPGFARKFLRAALAINPVAPKVWAHYLLSYAPALHAHARKRKTWKP